MTESNSNRKANEANGELPNLGLLIKLLKLTTASNDAEALSAMRKANEQLIKFGGDWEALLRGKVTVIGDPFANTTSMPPPEDTGTRGPAPTPQRHPPGRGRSYDPNPAQAPDNTDWDAVFRSPKQPSPKPSSPGRSGRSNRFSPQRNYPSSAPPQPPPKAPPGPIVFTKYRDGNWVLKSPTALNEGQAYLISKKGGAAARETCGAFIEQDHNGYFLYRIGKASKWKHRYGGGPIGIEDIV